MQHNAKIIWQYFIIIIVIEENRTGICFWNIKINKYRSIFIKNFHDVFYQGEVIIYIVSVW